MQSIPILSVPSQVVNTVLGGQSCKLNIYQKSTGVFMDVYVNDALIIGGVICEDRNLIVRDAYLGFIGDLIWVDTQPGPSKAAGSSSIIPASNYATFDPTKKNINVQLSGGNLVAAVNDIDFDPPYSVLSTVFNSSALRYCEFTCSAPNPGDSFWIGLATAAANLTDEAFIGFDVNGYSMQAGPGSNPVYYNGTIPADIGSGQPQYPVDIVYGMLLDLNAGTVAFQANGVPLLNGASPFAFTEIAQANYCPAASVQGGATVMYNAGATPWKYPAFAIGATGWYLA